MCLRFPGTPSLPSMGRAGSGNQRKSRIKEMQLLAVGSLDAPTSKDYGNTGLPRAAFAIVDISVLFHITCDSLEFFLPLDTETYHPTCHFISFFFLSFFLYLDIGHLPTVVFSSYTISSSTSTHPGHQIPIYRRTVLD